MVLLRNATKTNMISVVVFQDTSHHYYAIMNKQQSNVNLYNIYFYIFHYNIKNHNISKLLCIGFLNLYVYLENLA